MNKMGIKIDLSQFFQDERKMVYIMVDQNWESVESLQKRVEYLFDVDSVRFLNSDGCYLPPQESIEIIKFCEGLKAFVPVESLNRRKKKKSKILKCVQKSPQESDSGEKLNNIGDVQTKRKYYSLDSIHTDGTASNLAKRLKSSAAINESLLPITQDNKCMEITSTSEQRQPKNVQTQHTVAATSGKKTKTRHFKDVENGIIEQNSEQKMEIDNGEDKIYNIKSSASSTVIPSSTFLNDSNMIAQEHLQKVTLNSSNLNNPCRNQLSSKAHIYFNESGEIVSTTKKPQSKSDKESKTIVIFRCPLQVNKEETQKPRVFCIERKSSDNKSKKQFIEIKESIVLAPIQNLVFENKNSLTKDNAATNLKHEQKNTEIFEIAVKADLLKEKTVLSDTTNIAESTTIAKNINMTLDNCTEKSQIENNTELALSEQNSISKLTSRKINESCTKPVNRVDLSKESEKGDVVKTKLKIIKEKHDVTSDKNENDSSSDEEEISEIIDLNETEDNCNSTFSDSSTNSRFLNNIKVDKILPFCTNISEIPNINDIIVFKMAYANKKQSGETNFIAGKVEYINKRTKNIKVLILDGIAEISHIDSKFFFDLEDSEDFIKYLQVKMTDIIEPKIFSGR